MAKKSDCELEINQSRLKDEQGREIAVIARKGDITVKEAPPFKAELNRMLETPECGGVIIDLSKVTYLDGTSLGVLIGSLKRARGDNKTFKLVCPNPRVRRMFEITGLDKIFDIYYTQEEALGV